MPIPPPAGPSLSHEEALELIADLSRVSRRSGKPGELRLRFLPTGEVVVSDVTL